MERYLTEFLNNYFPFLRRSESGLRIATGVEVSRFSIANGYRLKTSHSGLTFAIRIRCGAVLDVEPAPQIRGLRARDRRFRAGHSAKPTDRRSVVPRPMYFSESRSQIAVFSE